MICFGESWSTFMREKKLSIVIPTYNGAEFLSDTLDSILSQGMNDEIEVVVCDDLSADDTFDIVRKFSETYGDTIKLYRNSLNLGMDKNFEKVVTYATGEYFWFCGQDDVFEKGAIEKVLSVIQTNSAIDFIFVNYSQNNHDLSEVITDKMLNIDKDILCRDPETFLSVTDLILPTFLPAFVLRRYLWDEIDKTTFYGTQYIQLGVLLTLLPNITTYIIANPYVRGRIPDNGWQQNKIKLVDIFSGHLEVITYAHRLNPGLITASIYERHFAFCWDNIFQLICQLRLEGLKLDKKLTRRFNSIFKAKYNLLTKLCFIIPRKYNERFFRLAKKLGF